MTPAALQEMVDGCPFHRFLGLTVEHCDAAAGTVSISLRARAEMSRDDGRIELHGGVMATLIDIAGDYAVALRTGQGVPTIGLNVDYLRMARGEKAIATARLIKCGRSIAVADIEVRDEAGTLVAIGRGTYASAAKPAPQT